MRGPTPSTAFNRSGEIYGTFTALVQTVGPQPQILYTCLRSSPCWLSKLAQGSPLEVQFSPAEVFQNLEP